MATVPLLVLFVLFHLVHLHSAQEPKMHPHNCPPSFSCAKLANNVSLTFPFTLPQYPDCGLFSVSGCNGSVQMIQLEFGRRWYQIENIISESDTILINDPTLGKNLASSSCDYFNDLALPPYVSFHSIYNMSMFKCNRTLDNPSFKQLRNVSCDASNYYIYYSHPDNGLLFSSPPPNCSLIQLPVTPEAHDDDDDDLFKMLSPEFSLQVLLNNDCIRCHDDGGMCEPDGQGNFHCPKHKGNNRLGLKLGLGIGCPVSAFVVVFCLFFYIRRRRHKQKYASTDYMSRNMSSDPSSTVDLEGGSIYYGVPIFSHSELEEATDNFSESNEIGDGGFGAVYYGKLRDGREVAVKRLYEHNYKRLEQFLNEIEILTRLRHKNLVSLYGCTSRRSRELLLVYEFIPNGTLAYHLHGEGPKTGSMTWPIRMNIAIETACALAYLHASDTIHRDVKTDNILLDNNFCVKVADFGLSRLFPNDVTHVSTAPQGTPGYVDPEYHQCYQLTDRSDVYSFGVVLIELISSMPAVDISRHRHDINLANLALSRIQKRAFSELVDPSLGFDSDENVRTMIMLVAELAFRCLQQDKEMRPDMEEVLENLKTIESSGGKYEIMENNAAENEEAADDDSVGVLKKNVRPLPSPDCCDEAGLLKNMQTQPSPDFKEVGATLKSMRPPHSPNSVTDRWISTSTTPNASG